MLKPIAVQAYMSFVAQFLLGNFRSIAPTQSSLLRRGGSIVIYFLNISFRRSMLRTAGFVRILSSSSPNTRDRPQSAWLKT